MQRTLLLSLSVAVHLALAGGLSGCSLALSNDFAFPDAGAGSDAARDAQPLDAMDARSDAPPGDAGECMGASDCTDVLPGMVASCVMATCMYACDADRADCDENPANGCEVDLSGDRDHCGSCDTVCDAENTSPSCSAGRCVYACTTGFSDCDTTAPDCETMLGDGTNCASCGDACGAGRFCSTLGATPTCAVDCPTGTVCGTSCVDVATSTAHCGGCGMPCGGGEAMWSCVSRSCVVTDCNMGFADCDGSDTNGCEVNLRTSLTDCGGCGMRCDPPNSSGVCSSTGCGIALCDAGFGDCDSIVATGCETDLRTLSNCGGCGLACAPANATPSCSAMTCAIAACLAGYADCGGGVGDGCETSTRTLSDCGGCGVSCALPNAGETCSAGTCEVTTCEPGYGDCDGRDATGCELELLSDESNCGACGHTCGAGTECVAGVCDPVIDVAPGITHSCALRRSGRAYCWGVNEAGQLGDGTIVEHGTPLPVVGRLFDQITAGQNFSCGIERATARVLCWGRGANGELGDGTGSNRSAPVATLSDDPSFATRAFVEVRALVSGACARDTTGDVWCWGRNSFGEVGNGTVGMTLRAVRVATVSGALELSVGSAYACARTASEVWCWGENGLGQLGDGSTIHRSSPVRVMGLPGPATALSAGAYHGCAIVAGDVHCWGRNDVGELGRVGPSSNLAIDNGVDADAIACGSLLCFARTAAGWVGWGYNAEGQLGSGTETPRELPPIALPHPRTSRLIAGPSSFGIDLSGRLTAWGADFGGQLGIRDLSVRGPTRSSDATGVLTGVDAVFTGGYSTLLLRSDQLSVAGYNNTGILARPSPGASDVPLPVSLPSPTLSAAAGRNFACAIAGSPARVHCWGSSAGIASSVTPVVTALPGTPTAIAAGHGHVCAIVDTGSANTPYCWGYNANGTLGRGTMGPADATPTAVLGGITDAVQLSLGIDHSCVRRASGAVACWGFNGDGRVGDGSGLLRTAPVAVSGLTDAIDLEVGTTHSCAVRAGGTVVCWGPNASGQLGDGTSTARLAPVTASILGARTATRIAAGGRHSCAIAAGEVFCWGANSEGQLGLGHRMPTSTLVSLGFTNAVDITSARNTVELAGHTCALLGDATSSCWGIGSQGRLAGGQDLSVSTPAPVLLEY
jgi:alpha-tubulin suppressor-like RCC1 family protein